MVLKYPYNALNLKNERRKISMYRDALYLG